ncbi:MAG: hypothetical protein ABJA94_08760, partial [Rhodoglobus sp.]
MADLAGFDLLIELSTRTLSDTVNKRRLAKDPEGNDIHLFGGPFVLDAQTTIAGNGAQFRLIAEAYLRPVLQSPTTRVEIDLRDCSFQIGNQAATGLEGTVLVTVPAPEFEQALATPSTPSPTVDDWNPTLPFDRCAISVVLTDTSRGDVEGLVGQGNAGIAEQAIENVLRQALATLDGRIDLTFRVKPGQDSDSPGQLSAFPEFRWIDRTTFAIFGYYHAGASGGSAAAKVNSDIASQPSDWVQDDRPTATGRIPAERFGIFLSARGFDLVIGRPAVRSTIRKLVREKAAEEQRPRAEQQRPHIESTVRGKRNQYIDEERTRNNNGGPATQAELEAADQRIAREIKDEVESLRWRLADDYLTHHDGLQRLESETPYSAGSGRYVQAVPMPDPLPATTAFLHYLTLLLDSGHLTLIAKARAALPEILGISCGDLDAQVSARVSLSYFGRTITPSLVMDLPDVHYDANPVCSAVAAGAAFSITGPVGGTLLTLMMDPLIEAFATIEISRTVGKQLAGIAAAMPLPMPDEVKAIVNVPIDPQSFGVVALLPWRFDRNSFEPGIRLDLTRETHKPSATPEAHGTYTFAATKWGCPEQTFNYVERFWDTVWVVSVVDRAIPLPVKILGWYAQFGSATMNSIAGMSVVDPRPHYYGSSPMPPAPPALSGNASVWFESPPPSGRVESRPALRVGAQ